MLLESARHEYSSTTIGVHLELLDRPSSVKIKLTTMHPLGVRNPLAVIVEQRIELPKNAADMSETRHIGSLMEPANILPN